MLAGGVCGGGGVAHPQCWMEVEVEVCRLDLHLHTLDLYLYLDTPLTVTNYHPPVHCAQAPAQNGAKGPIMGGGAFRGGPFSG